MARRLSMRGGRPGRCTAALAVALGCSGLQTVFLAAPTFPEPSQGLGRAAGPEPHPRQGSATLQPQFQLQAGGAPEAPPGFVPALCLCAHLILAVLDLAAAAALGAPAASAVEAVLPGVCATKALDDGLRLRHWGPLHGAAAKACALCHCCVPLLILVMDGHRRQRAAPLLWAADGATASALLSALALALVAVGLAHVWPKAPEEVMEDLARARRSAPAACASLKRGGLPRAARCTQILVVPCVVTVWAVSWEAASVFVAGGPGAPLGACAATLLLMLAPLGLADACAPAHFVSVYHFLQNAAELIFLLGVDSARVAA